MNFRRFSFLAETTDHDIDEGFQNLYPKSSVIEEWSQKSITDRTSLTIKGNSQRYILPAKVSYDKSFQEVMQDLPEDYYNKDFNPVVAHLEEVSQWDEDDMIEHFMEKIEATDTDKDIIIGELTSMIDANYDELMSCMRKVQEVSFQLKAAGSTTEEAKLRINTARNILKTGALNVVTLNARKQKKLLVLNTLKNLKDVQRLNSQFQQRLALGEVDMAAEIAVTLDEYLTTQKCDEFIAVETLRDKFSSGLLDLKTQVDHLLRTVCCNRFDHTEYQRLLKSYLYLEYIHNNKFTSGDPLATSQRGLNGLQTLPQLVNHFQTAAIEQCFRNAASEVTVRPDRSSLRRKSLLVSPPSAMGGFDEDNVLEMLQSTEVPIHVVYKKLPPEAVPASIARACELMLDVLFTNYLITQWHLTPFATENENIDFLLRGTPFDPHRENNSNTDKKSINPFPDEKSVQQSITTSCQSFLESLRVTSIGETFFTQQSMISDRFYDIQKGFMQYKILLWEDILRRLLSLLKLFKFGTEIKLEECVKMVSTLQSFAEMGESFCGTSSSTLLDYLQDLATGFFIQYHTEAFHMLKLMVESELWQSIPLSGKDETYSLSAVIKNLAKGTATTATSLEEEEAEAEKLKANKLLEGFKGTPIRSTLHSMSPSTSPKPGSHHHHHTPALIENPMLRPLREKTQQYLRKTFFDAHFRDQEENEEQNGTNGGKRQLKRSAHTVVATHSSLYGVTKHVVKYLDILSSMPVNAKEVIDCIFQLFSFYLCAVFYGFVSSEEQTKLLTPSTKVNSVAPDLMREFEMIKQFIIKAYEELIVVKPFDEDDEDDRGDSYSDPRSSLNGNSSHLEGTNNNSPNPMNNHTNNTTTTASGSITSNNMIETVKLSELLIVPAFIAAAGVHNCYALKERMVAAESCHSVARMLLELKPMVVSYLSEEAAVKELNEEIENYVYAAEQLRSLIYKSICPTLVNQEEQLLTSISGSAWEARVAPQRQHDWVDRMVGNCRKIWDYISNPINGFVDIIQEQIWLELCQAAFDLMLEGFSKVRRCTAEGRAAMTLDLFALHEGLNRIHACRPLHGKVYLDSYIRSAYLTEEEVMAWVQQNWQAYAYRHISGLLHQTISSGKRLRDAIAVIDGLYEVERTPAPTTTSTIGSMFSTRGESKFSTMLIPKFRR